MAALGASETAFWSPYTAQIDARSVACTPFQTVSLGSRVNNASIRASTARRVGARIAKMYVTVPAIL
jgi:hypothetical protein